MLVISCCSVVRESSFSAQETLILNFKSRKPWALIAPTPMLKLIVSKILSPNISSQTRNQEVGLQSFLLLKFKNR
jgi:hypothetical protein